MEGAGKAAEFAGVATQEDDEHALTAVLEILSANAIADSDADATAVLQPAAAATRRRPIALSTLAALVLLSRGSGAAFLSTSGESTSDNADGLGLAPHLDRVNRELRKRPWSLIPGTSSEQSTEQKTAPSPTTEPPLTNSPPPTEPATTAPPVTTEPPSAAAEPPPTTATAARHDRAAAATRSRRLPRPSRRRRPQP